MARARKLRNAPVVEALIDIRVRSRPGFQAEEFRKLVPELASRYPIADEQRAVQAQFEMRPGQQPSQASRDLGLQGLLFRPTDRLSIVQFRADGFTFNRLKPYTSWEHIFPEAMSLWRMYRSIAQPLGVTRLALRYIDHLRAPLPVQELGGYLTAPPQVPDELPQDLVEYLTSILVHDVSSEVLARITQTMRSGVEPSVVTFILDVDAFRNVDLPPDSPDIEPIFLALRSFKNTAFFACFTERALEPYS